jgi:hypothetical protein
VTLESRRLCRCVFAMAGVPCHPPVSKDDRIRG